MSSTLGLAESRFSAGRWVTEPSADAPLQPADLDLLARRPSIGRRASRAIVRFLITFCIGVAVTLAWQSDAVRQLIANSSPQLGWLAPKVAPVAQTAPTVPAAPVVDQEQLGAVRQGIDQLAAKLSAGQERLMSDITKLQAIQQDILEKISPPLSAPVPADVQAHKPAPLPLPPRAPAAR
jgi:hypothetical protein